MAFKTKKWSGPREEAAGEERRKEKNDDGRGRDRECSLFSTCFLFSHLLAKLPSNKLNFNYHLLRQGYKHHCIRSPFSCLAPCMSHALHQFVINKVSYHQAKRRSRAQFFWPSGFYCVSQSYAMTVVAADQLFFKGHHSLRAIILSHWLLSMSLLFPGKILDEKSSKQMSIVLSRFRLFLLFHRHKNYCSMQWLKHESDRNDYEEKLMRWINGYAFRPVNLCVYQVTLSNCPSFPFLCLLSTETGSIHRTFYFLSPHSQDGHSLTIVREDWPSVLPSPLIYLTASVFRRRWEIGPLLPVQFVCYYTSRHSRSHNFQWRGQRLTTILFRGHFTWSSHSFFETSRISKSVSYSTHSPFSIFLSRIFETQLMIMSLIGSSSNIRENSATKGEKQILSIFGQHNEQGWKHFTLITVC